MDHLKKKMEDNAMDALSKPNPSIKDVRDVLNLIIEKMWSEERLANFVRSVHAGECANCKKAGSVKWYKRTICALLGLIGTLIGLLKMYAGGAQ